MTQKTGMERLENYKFYELHEPYFALIKSKDIFEAVELYIEVVAGDVSEIFELLKETKEVSTEHALVRYTQSYVYPAIKINQTYKGYMEYLLKDESNVLLIDGSLQ